MPPADWAAFFLTAKWLLGHVTLSGNCSQNLGVGGCRRPVFQGLGIKHELRDHQKLYTGRTLFAQRAVRRKTASPANQQHHRN
jgi:hypothetical protein